MGGSEAGEGGRVVQCGTAARTWDASVECRRGGWTGGGVVVGSDGRTDMRAGKAERLVVLATGSWNPPCMRIVRYIL